MAGYDPLKGGLVSAAFFGNKTAQEEMGKIYAAQEAAYGLEAAAAAKAGGDIRAAEEHRRGQVEATGIASARNLAARKYEADTMKDWTKTETGAKYLAERTPQALGLQQLATDKRQKQNENAFQTGVYNIPGVGGIDKGTGEFKYADPNFETIVKKHLTTAGEDPNAALQAATAELGRAQIGTEAYLSKAMANWNIYHGGSPPPGSETKFTNKDLTPEKESFLKYWGSYKPTKPAAATGQTSTATDVIPGHSYVEAPAVGASLDRLAQLGQNLKYELQPLSSKQPGGEVAPSLENIRSQRIAERERLLNKESALGRAASAM